MNRIEELKFRIKEFDVDIIGMKGQIKDMEKQRWLWNLELCMRMDDYSSSEIDSLLKKFEKN